MDYAHFSPPAAEAAPSARSAFLRTVGLLTAGGLAYTAVIGALSALMIPTVVSAVPLLGSRIGQLVVILGCFGITQYVAPGIVNSAGPQRWLGFLLGTTAQGIALGWLLLAALLMGMADYANPFALIIQAFGLVGLLTVGMVAWLITGPKELNLVQGALAILTLPMLALMALSFAFPLGGIVGVIVSAVFVAVSGAGLLVQLNRVFHHHPVNAPMPAAYGVTIGLLVLYWNLLSLLMSLNRR